MARRLVLDPATTAVITQECQEGIIGEGSALAELAAAARERVVPSLARLLPVARLGGSPIIHCVMLRRPGSVGASVNAPLFRAASKLPLDLAEGGPGARVAAGIGAEPSDLVLGRFHGLGPVAGTDLDATLRNLGVRTVIVTGVSLNVAIPNAVMDAVNLGYDVIVPRDAVAGVPEAYAESIIDNTLSLLAAITTTDELIEAFQAEA